MSEEPVETDAVADDAATRRPNLWAGLALLVLGLIVLPFGGLYLYGLFLPEAYQVQVAGTVQAPVEVVYDTLTDPDLQGDWRPGVQSAELGEPIDGQPVVALTTGETTLTLQRTEAVPHSRVVWTVVPSRKHVYVGHWLLELAPVEGGTRVICTEHGEINSALARAASHALLGMDSYCRATLGAIGVYHEVEVSLDDAPAP